MLFLAEAFTRPAMMHELARIGFTQSLHVLHLAHRASGELEEYGRELAARRRTTCGRTSSSTPRTSCTSPCSTAARRCSRSGPCWPRRCRPTWGVYSGFELFEHVAVRPGSEEYLDSEKYQLRPRDWAGAEREGRSLAPYLTRLNEIRRAHPALQQLRNLHFHHVDNDERCICLLARRDRRHRATPCSWSSTSTRTTPARRRSSLDMPALGLDWHERFAVHDELTGDDLRLGPAQLRAARPVPRAGARLRGRPCRVGAVTDRRARRVAPAGRTATVTEADRQR